MRRIKKLKIALSCMLAAALATPAFGADYPAPKEGNWVVSNFPLASGAVMPELRMHYTTVGDPSGEPVLILHGTNGSGTGMLTAAFAGQLFGPGQALDARKYYVILPDGLGSGQSSKPSDGLRATFPKYNYDDLVEAQYRLVTEGLGVKHLRLVLGNSMGGMQTWIWAEKHPQFMDLAVPMASLPIAMSGRNWLMRRFFIDAIRNDPEWLNGNYTQQPRNLQMTTVYFGIATNGGSQGLYQLAPTRAAADRLLTARLSAPLQSDANDVLYQWEAAGDYDPSASLERIEAVVLAINSADDERNPPELGVMEHALKRIQRGSALLIPASAQTMGHGTTANAVFWNKQVESALQATPHAVPKRMN